MQPRPIAATVGPFLPRLRRGRLDWLALTEKNPVWSGACQFLFTCRRSVAISGIETTSNGFEYSVHPIQRGLRPRGEQCRCLPPAKNRRGGLAGQYGAFFESHRLRHMERIDSAGG